MGHNLYKPKDFTAEQIDRREKVAIMVVEGGLEICKDCGAGEMDLDGYDTCEEYREHMEVIQARVPCTDGDCGDFRNMNGGCDVCGQPCF